jgi:glycosyltransferase involved in cell wall biosynthesis
MKELSIIIPVGPGKHKRLVSFLSRLTLNQAKHPDYKFEVIVVDGGDSAPTKELCGRMANFLSLKYVYIPIKQWISKAYPINVGLRISEGKVIAPISVDYWIGESIVPGILKPFINGWPTEPKSASLIINAGTTFKSNSSELTNGNTEKMGQLVDRILVNTDWCIEDLCQKAKLHKNRNISPDIFAVERENLLPLNGYDEIYCLGYSGETKDLLCRLDSLTYVKYPNFQAIHLWHEDGLSLPTIIDDDYFTDQCCPFGNIQTKRNIKHEWGKLLQYSFSVINGEVLTGEQHEKWIAQNIPDMPSYQDSWIDIESFIRFLKKYRWRK